MYLLFTLFILLFIYLKNSWHFNDGYLCFYWFFLIWPLSKLSLILLFIR